MRARGGKTIHGWLAKGDPDLSPFRSGFCEIVWPPRSGRTLRVPEADAVRYSSEGEALTRIHLGQRPILREAFDRLRNRTPPAAA